ncbi:MAG: hypothetical protein U1C96_03530 [Gallionella sp.]|nr:hypothetical protein [Gallionella sp.]
MLSPELLLVSVLKALIEIALMALLAQGVVGLLSGQARQQNFVYRLLQVVTAPVSRITRTITPGFIPDRHLGWCAFFLLFWLWVALVYAKSHVCHSQNLACLPG